MALALPTRRPFDTTDQLDERIRRADAAFAMAYELGTTIVLARAGAVPPADDATRAGLHHTLLELGRPGRAHGVRLALETGAEPREKLKSFLDAIGLAGPGGQHRPRQHLASGHRPDRCRVRELAAWVVHAYAKDATGSSVSARSQPAWFWLSARGP